MNREILISEMAHILRGPGVDLGDERSVIHALQNARYLASEIFDCMDDAIDRARVEWAQCRS